VKFCFILDRMFLETFRMLKQVFGDEAMSKHKPMSGTNVFKRAELQSETINIQDNFQHQNVMKTCKKYGK